MLMSVPRLTTSVMGAGVRTRLAATSVCVLKDMNWIAQDTSVLVRYMLVFWSFFLPIQVVVPQSDLNYLRLI